MLVRNGTIEKMFIEPREPGDPFKVSDADTMLNYINPNARQARPGGDPDARRLLVLREGEEACLPTPATTTSRSPLPHTIRTKAVGAIAGAQTVPQVFINGRLIGGSNELEAFLRKAA